MSDIISVEHLAYTYPGVEDTPGVPVFADLNLTIEEGSFVAVLGTNGCGKSTLAKHFNAILLPSGGKVYVCGIDTANEDRLIAIRRNVGMVFQNPDNQIVATVVEEDVAFGCENLGLPPAEIRRRVDDALAAVGMTAYARHAPHKLSGGQKQRVAIAGVIAMKRKIIIFDESTAMLDPMGRREVMDVILRLNREEGITVLMITHYMNEAAMADRVLVLDHGSVLCDGTPEAVFGDPERLWAAGLDVPQTTELLYRFRKLGYDVPIAVFDADECADVIAAAVSGSKKEAR